MEAQAAYHDFNGFSQLRVKARQDAVGAAGDVASQFESIFIQIMLKSMRDAVPEGGLFDSSQMTMYQEMFDQQVSLDMSRHGGIGLADIIEQQLGGGTSDPEQGGDKPKLGIEHYLKSPSSDIAQNPFVQPNLLSLNAASLGVGSSAISKDVKESNHAADQELAGRLESVVEREIARVTQINKADWVPGSPADFAAHVREHAARAAAELGVSENLLIAQAALETGWGQKLMKHQDGTSSFNLFGIKAKSGWPGETVTKLTLEYRNGIAQKESAQFRSYSSVGESFDDYVSFLRSSPRYADALVSAGSDEGFAWGLQNAGYATDPAYATKILNIKLRLDQAQALFALKNSHVSSLL